MAFKMKGYSAFKKTDPPKTKKKNPIKVTKKKTTSKKETSLERARRGLGLTKEQLLEEQRKQREALKKYEEKYG